MIMSSKFVSGICYVVPGGHIEFLIGIEYNRKAPWRRPIIPENFFNLPSVVLQLLIYVIFQDGCLVPILAEMSNRLQCNSNVPLDREKYCL